MIKFENLDFSDLQITGTDIAKVVVGLSYRKAREVIKRIFQSPHKFPKSIRSDVLKQLETKEINILMITFPEYVLKALRNESKNVSTRGNWLKQNMVSLYP